MALDPAKLSFVRWTDFIPVTAFSGMGDAPTITIIGGDASIVAIGLGDDADGSALSKVAATTRTGAAGVQPPRSSASGNPVLGEISASGVMGLLMNTNGDEVRNFMRIPNKWDRQHPIYLRVAWTTNSITVADTVLWQFRYNLMVPNTTQLGSSPVTELDTILVADNALATQRVIQLTEKGKINARSISNTDEYIFFTVEMGAKAGGLAESLWFVGLEVEYTPRLGRYHRRVEGEPWAATANPS